MNLFHQDEIFVCHRMVDIDLFAVYLHISEDLFEHVCKKLFIDDRL